MGNSKAASSLAVESWDDQYFVEFIRTNRFSKYIGPDENSVIQVKDVNLGEDGYTAHYGLMTKLTGDGVTGSETLEGNEEEINTYHDQLTVEWLRNAVAIDKKEQSKPAIDLLAKARPALMNWRKEKERSSIITCMQCPNLDGITAYASATEAQKDAWALANSDRILAGALKSNYSADHSAMLLNVDSTNDKFTPAILMIARRMALAASPAIRPIKVKDDEEFFVCFAGKWAFRDFKASTTYQTAAEYAAERGKDNPLFVSGDLLWENVIIREIPEIPVISGVGAGSIDVESVFLCGAQALIQGWAQRPKHQTQTRDYNFVTGIGVEECSGIKKAIFDNNKQHGMVTIYVSGVADA